MNPEPTIPNEPIDLRGDAENKPANLAEKTADAAVEKKESPTSKRTHLFYEAAYFWTIMRL